MPRFPKGSEEAKAWGLKMKKAREAKKSMKGGMMGDDEDDDELSDLFGKMSIPEKFEEKERPSAPIPIIKPVIIRRPGMESKEVPETTTGKQKRKSSSPTMPSKEPKGKGVKPIGLPLPLKTEAHGTKARRGRKPLDVMTGGFLQPGEAIPQEMEGGSLKSKLAALKAKLQQLKDRYK